MGFRNYFLLNLILLIIIGVLGFKLYETLNISINFPTPAIKQKPLPAETASAAPDEKNFDESIFQVIVQKDIFRPSRTEPRVEEISRPITSVVPPKLYGTVITENEKSAILEDQTTKVTRSYRVNDSIAGFVVSDIQKDKVILSSEDRTIEVYLRELKTFKAPGSPPPFTPRRPAPATQRPAPLPPPVTQPPPGPSGAAPALEDLEDGQRRPVIPPKHDEGTETTGNK